VSLNLGICNTSPAHFKQKLLPKHVLSAVFQGELQVCHLGKPYLLPENT
jgi:hypothetical protein